MRKVYQKDLKELQNELQNYFTKLRKDYQRKKRRNYM